MIGFVMLMGLAVKNAILLVDNANQHRRTLVVVPVILTYVDGLSRFIARFLPHAPDDHGIQLHPVQSEV